MKTTIVPCRAVNARRRPDIVRRFAVIVAACLALSAASSSTAAEPAGEVSRRVLAVYNGITAEGATEPQYTRIHKQLEMTFNHLGFFVDYADVNEPLPSFEPYRGILVWLDSYAMRDPDKLIPWLIQAMDAGVKIILPESLETPVGLDGRSADPGRLADFWTRFGLEPTGTGFGDAERYRLENLLPEKFGFETNASALAGNLAMLRPSKPDVKPWQIAVGVDDPERQAVTVAVGEAGGWAINERVLYFSFEMTGELYRLAWNLDPFAFVTAALDCRDLPKPDATTFWGARGAYSHVDVDGPYNMSQDWPGRPQYAFEIVYEKILKAIPFPVTLGFIACEYDPTLDVRFVEAGDTVATALARPRPEWQGKHADIAMAMREIAAKAMRLPHISAGCHGYAHPLYWRDKLPAYAIAGYDFNYEQEVFGAVDYLNRNVLPPDKPVELYQWSGDCEPPAEPFAILERMGMANINGGDPRYDGKYSSIYYVCPVSRPVERYLQIHTSGSNENIYTDGWTGFKGAFNNVVATFERSDSPRRLLPVNIYYHVFPAERQAGAYVIKHAYDWAAGQNLCWMRAAEYSRAAQSFAKVRIGRTGDGGWWAEEYGTCPSLRFDGESRDPDMAASVNVAGWFRHGGSLYVSLIPGARAEVRFPSAATSVLAAPALARASGMLRNIDAGGRRWRAEVCGWGPGFVELWAPDGDWRASATFPDGSRPETAVRRLDDGRLRLEFPDAAGKWVEVVFEH